MSNWHRIAWIDMQIRENRYPNCSRISERFNISVRQASRDVEYLRDSMDAPVKYCPLKRGYQYTDATFQLPAVMITEQQKRAISLLAQQSKAMAGEDRLGMADLFGKLERLTEERHGLLRSAAQQKKGIKEAEERAAAVLNSAMTSPLLPRTEPFYADVQIEPADAVEVLRLEATPIGNSVFQVRYYSVELFARLLLSMPYEFRIISPNWLRNLIRYRLEKKLRGLSR